MKAILIDPAKREIKGIELDDINIGVDLAKAFGGQKVVLLHKLVGTSHVVYYNGRSSKDDKTFWITTGVGPAQIIKGKALLLGRELAGWACATTFTVKEVECLVRFAS